MAELLVSMGAKEYYSGGITVDLPFGLIEDDIDDVQPDGYGQFWVFLEDSGKHKVKAYIDNNDLQFQEHGFRCWCQTIPLEDWKIVQMSSTGEIVLEWNWEIDLEFCEVDENLVEHWEVNDGNV